MEKKPSTPEREKRRRYEEKNKEKRKQNKHFATFIPLADFEEIDAFLKEHNLTKVNLIYAGYMALKQSIEEQKATLEHNQL